MTQNENNFPGVNGAGAVWQIIATSEKNNFFRGEMLEKRKKKTQKKQTKMSLIVFLARPQTRLSKQQDEVTLVMTPIDS